MLFFRFRVVLVLAFGAISAVPLHASPTISSPKVGSPLRRAVLDALRKPVEKYNKRSVIFTEVDLKTSGPWAYVDALPTDGRGHKLGPRDMYSVSALLRKTGTKWRVLEWVYAGDVVSIGWENKYPSVPRKLWPHRR